MHGSTISTITIRGHGSEEAGVQEENNDEDRIHVDNKDVEDGYCDVDDDDVDILRMPKGNNNDDGCEIHVHGASVVDSGVSIQGKTG